ncbi:DUF6493 family protein [Microbispora hainanensis]|uniref:DUF7824 domain-containing protein n=1 Tax=Microbispora hainanensis TaxID=568844 RepID=A0A544YZV0_9ACTN|nr:DUF6493 family protein [Microbispora hainanensis]TQS22316.1 hypothetical protein FLX08_07920 [Microbispora hainanensis]
MSSWKEVAARIDAGDGRKLAPFLTTLDEHGRRAVADRLPEYLSERPAQGWEGRRWVQDRADALRLVGAACLSGAAQVAAWLNRRDLRWVREPEADAARILALIGDRPAVWREDLAVRLVERLRLPSRSASRLMENGVPGWELAAGLVLETGVEPPDNDAFTTGWLWRLVRRHSMYRGTRDTLAGDPLLGHLLPRVFRAAGVAQALTRDLEWNRDRGVVAALLALAEQGRVPRQVLVSGCVERFLAGGEADEIAPFVTLWRGLRPEPGEIPAVEFVRLLPSAPSPFVQLALEELGRLDEAGLLGDEPFAEAVAALAFRPEKKYVTAAVRWIAGAAPSRADGALPALAAVFGQDTGALWDRAVRLAVRFAPHASGPALDTVRTAASRLPADLREKIAAVAGPVEAAEPPAVAPAALTVNPLPALPPVLASPEDLAWEIEALRRPTEPPRFERILAALVQLTHRDRDTVTRALRPWWHKRWRQPFDPAIYVYGISDFGRDTHTLLMRCALAVVAPADSRKLSALLADYHRSHLYNEPAIQLLIQRRLREVVEMLEAGRSVPVLLATPTSPTGHVDTATLIERMERLEGAEPLPADFHQALLRLPREIDPRAAVRAEGLTSRAGRTLAEWLRRGGLPDPEVTVGMKTAQRPDAHWNSGAHHYIGVREMYARIVPPDGVPGPVAELCTGPAPAAYGRETVWWPAAMPSHREVVAAHLLETLTLDIDGPRGGGEVLVALVHGDGPVGAATASALAVGMGNKHPADRGATVEALVTLTARGQLPAADLGQAVARLVDAGLVKLNRITAALDEATTAGAHVAVWRVLLTALPPLLPRAGDKPRAGLGELLAVAVKAATLSGERAGIPGLAEVAARGGSSRLVQEARRLQQQVSR